MDAEILDGKDLFAFTRRVAQREKSIDEHTVLGVIGSGEYATGYTYSLDHNYSVGPLCSCLEFALFCYYPLNVKKLGVIL